MFVIHVPILCGAALALSIAFSVLRTVAALKISTAKASVNDPTTANKTQQGLLRAFKQILRLAVAVSLFLCVFAACTLLLVPKIHSMSVWFWDFLLCIQKVQHKIMSEGASTCEDIGTSLDDAPSRPSASVMGLTYAVQAGVPLLLGGFNLSMNRLRYIKAIKGKEKREVLPESSVTGSAIEMSSYNSSAGRLGSSTGRATTRTSGNSN